MILVSRTILIITDVTLAIVITLMNYTNGGITKNPVILNLLLIVAIASAIIRHINYYKLTKRIY